LPPLPTPADNAAMEAEPVNSPPPNRKRRWLQFSLRSLLIFMLICAVGFAWVGRKIEQKRIEREAVEAIVKAGGEVLYDYQHARRTSPPGPGWLRKLLGEYFFSEVDSVSLDSAFLDERRFPSFNTDAELVNVKQLTQLKWLIVGFRTTVTDAGLVNLRGLTELRALELPGPGVTDAGLENLKGLTRLKSLRLTGTKITDAGIVNLKGLPELQQLDLSMTNITDAGLVSIKGLANLRKLSLTGTNVTAAAVEDVRQALPNCAIDFRQDGGDRARR
jgi:hypothetical protein